MAFRRSMFLVVVLVPLLYSLHLKSLVDEQTHIDHLIRSEALITWKRSRETCSNPDQRKLFAVCEDYERAAERVNRTTPWYTTWDRVAKKEYNTILLPFLSPLFVLLSTLVDTLVSLLRAIKSSLLFVDRFEDEITKYAWIAVPVVGASILLLIVGLAIRFIINTCVHSVQRILLTPIRMLHMKNNLASNDTLHERLMQPLPAQKQALPAPHHVDQTVITEYIQPEVESYTHEAPIELVPLKEPLTRQMPLPQQSTYPMDYSHLVHTPTTTPTTWSLPMNPSATWSPGAALGWKQNTRTKEQEKADYLQTRQRISTRERAIV